MSTQMARRQFSAQRQQALNRQQFISRRPLITCSTSAAGTPSTASVGDITSVYTSQAYSHKRAVGPVQLEIVPGKGLGWRASRDVATGELLLASLPLVVMYGSPGEPPSNDDLLMAVRQSYPRLTKLERRWLGLLCDCCATTAPSTQHGTTAPAAAAVPPPAAAAAASTAASAVCTTEGLLAQARALLAETAAGVAERDVTSSSAGAEASGGSNADSNPAAGAAVDAPSADGLAPLTPLLPLLIQRYSYCEPREDPAVAELQQLPPEAAMSPAGLWPEAALLNHSCCPNASVLLVGGAMYVRAGRALLQGEEVTVSYLGGKGLFQDVAERRRQLRGSHGFICCCPRCIMEHEHFPTRRYPELLEQQKQQQQKQRTRNSSSSNSSSGGGGGDGGDSNQGIDDSLLASALMSRRGAGVNSTAAAAAGGGGGGGARAKGPLQAVLDAVFGPGRFRTTGLAPDHRVLATANAVLAAEWEAAAHSALTAATAPRRQQAELLDKLEGALGAVESACSYLDLPPKGRLMVFASVYGVVRLTCDLAELLAMTTSTTSTATGATVRGNGINGFEARGLVDPKSDAAAAAAAAVAAIGGGKVGASMVSERRLQLLQLAAAVTESVAPGSDAHVTAAVKVNDNKLVFTFLP
ncbi:hypothetical protein Agub_g13687 [Astrephomene gubernaculifera]|uniref:SET domain-containing protein n=1 Tax=Astrephomene gubernaculifera TaxID=47775 RepID=A0AAD3HSK1_9CHLO|nr:hypothetical protein Agub_g13687 [Astrephomene gubernaculifera]